MVQGSNPEIKPGFLSTEDLATYLGLSKSTIHQWCHEGTGPPFFKIGIHRRFRMEDVEAWLKDHFRTRSVPRGKGAQEIVRIEDLDKS